MVCSVSLCFVSFRLVSYVLMCVEPLCVGLVLVRVVCCVMLLFDCLGVCISCVGVVLWLYVSVLHC